MGEGGGGRERPSAMGAGRGHQSWGQGEAISHGGRERPSAMGAGRGHQPWGQGEAISHGGRERPSVMGEGGGGGREKPSAMGASAVPVSRTKKKIHPYYEYPYK